MEYPFYLNPLLLSFGFFQPPISNLMLSLSLQHASSHIILDFPASCSFVPLSNLALLKIPMQRGGSGHPCLMIVVTECQRGLLKDLSQVLEAAIKIIFLNKTRSGNCSNYVEVPSMCQYLFSSPNQIELWNICDYFLSSFRSAQIYFGLFHQVRTRILTRRRMNLP